MRGGQLQNLIVGYVVSFQVNLDIPCAEGEHSTAIEMQDAFGDRVMTREKTSLNVLP